LVGQLSSRPVPGICPTLETWWRKSNSATNEEILFIGNTSCLPAKSGIITGWVNL
jgi:hypothetical protein